MQTNHQFDDLMEEIVFLKISTKQVNYLGINITGHVPVCGEN